MGMAKYAVAIPITGQMTAVVDADSEEHVAEGE